MRDFKRVEKPKSNNVMQRTSDREMLTREHIYSGTWALVRARTTIIVHYLRD